MESEQAPRLIWSWALYDWANSAFATTVMAGFFPLFFKSYWSMGFSVTESTYVLGLTNSGASIMIALCSPALGAVADQGAYRKRFLFAFTLLGAGASMALAYVGQGQWLSAVTLYTVGVIGFTMALTFYDALLVIVAKPEQLDRISGLGYGLGYLGGGLLFAVNVLMYQRPEWFGLSSGPEGVLASFTSVGVWWLAFALPLFLLVPEPKPVGAIKLSTACRTGFASLAVHIRSLRSNKPLLFFLVGYLFYIDGVNTIVKMAVDYGLSIGLQPGDLIKALLLVQFIGFPAAILFGIAGERLGPRRGIWICITAYLAVTVFAYRLESATEFYILAAVIGLVQGGIQALSRSYYARLVPTEESAQYFGFFNMAGKFSSILGPFLVATTGMWLNNPRAGILVLILFFLVGGYFVARSQALEHSA